MLDDHHLFTHDGLIGGISKEFFRETLIEMAVGMDTDGII
jgi:hypothetical protein